MNLLVQLSFCIHCVFLLTIIIVVYVHASPNPYKVKVSKIKDSPNSVKLGAASYGRKKMSYFKKKKLSSSKGPASLPKSLNKSPISPKFSKGQRNKIKKSYKKAERRKLGNGYKRKNLIVQYPKSKINESNLNKHTPKKSFYKKKKKRRLPNQKHFIPKKQLLSEKSQDRQKGRKANWSKKRLRVLSLKPHAINYTKATTPIPITRKWTPGIMTEHNRTVHIHNDGSITVHRNGYKKHFKNLDYYEEDLKKEEREIKEKGKKKKHQALFSIDDGDGCDRYVNGLCYEDHIIKCTKRDWNKNCIEGLKLPYVVKEDGLVTEKPFAFTEAPQSYRLYDWGIYRSGKRRTCVVNNHHIYKRVDKSLKDDTCVPFEPLLRANPHLAEKIRREALSDPEMFKTKRKGNVVDIALSIIEQLIRFFNDASCFNVINYFEFLEPYLKDFVEPCSLK